MKANHCTLKILHVTAHSALQHSTLLHTALLIAYSLQYTAYSTLLTVHCPQFTAYLALLHSAELTMDGSPGHLVKADIMLDRVFSIT